jgi:hypothetical protein
MEDD